MCGLIVFVQSLKAALSFTGNYSQNFDSLSASETTGTWTDDSTIQGWYSSETSFIANHGNTSTLSLYDFGASGSSDRALGSITGSTKTPIYYGAAFNNSAGTITALLVSYRGEQWKGSASTPDQLTFQYLIGDPSGNSIANGTWITVTALAFTGPVSNSNAGLDGNLAQNSSSISFTITGLNIVNGGDFWVRWMDNDVAANDSGLAIDDFSITAVPEPAEWGLVSGAALSAICVFRLRRELRSRC